MTKNLTLLQVFHIFSIILTRLHNYMITTVRITSLVPILIGYFVSYVDTIRFIQKDVVDEDRLLMDKIQANTLDVQNQQNSMVALDSRQAQAYVQTLTQTITITITTLGAAVLTSVLVFVI